MSIRLFSWLFGGGGSAGVVVPSGDQALADPNTTGLLRPGIDWGAYDDNLPPGIDPGAWDGADLQPAPPTTIFVNPNAGEFAAKRKRRFKRFAGFTLGFTAGFGISGLSMSIGHRVALGVATWAVVAAIDDASGGTGDFATGFGWGLTAGGLTGTLYNLDSAIGGYADAAKEYMLDPSQDPLLQGTWALEQTATDVGSFLNYNAELMEEGMHNLPWMLK